MQYKVPQNVDIEDKVIGPLTLRQFTIILVGVGLIGFLYILIPEILRPLFWLLALIIGGASVLVAFSKYGDQNFEIFLLSVTKTLRLPRKRIWHKDFNSATSTKTEVVPTSKKEYHKKNLKEVRGSLKQLAEVVDSGGGANINTSDRIVSFSQEKTDDKETPDLLKKVESGQPVVENILKKANPPKREPLISEVASISPNKRFNWPKINKQL